MLGPQVHMAANLTESIGNGMSHAYTIHENTLKIVIPETSQQPVVAVSQPVEVPTEESIGTRSHGVCAHHVMQQIRPYMTPLCLL